MASSSSQPQENNDVSTQNIPTLIYSAAAEDLYKRRYLPVYKAALTGDWETAKRIFEEDTDSITARLTVSFQTPLHVSAGAGFKAIHFVEKLVEMLRPDELALRGAGGDTALHSAALTGNTKAAFILVSKNPRLLYISTAYGAYPVHLAARAAHKDTLSYLLSVTKDTVDPNPFANRSGAELLVNIIVSGFLDMALNLVQRYPYIATFKTKDGDSPLRAIARKVSAFPSGSGLNFWQRFIYSWVPVSLENYANNANRSDAENPAANCQVFMNIQSGLVFQKLQLMFWKVSELLVPCIKHIRKEKMNHNLAIQLVKRLCLQIASMEDKHFDASLYTIPMYEAARLGVHEVVEEIVDAYPAALWGFDSKNRHILHIAILHRCENVFNLIYQMSTHKDFLTMRLDSLRNSVLHSAGYLAPSYKLNLVSGAALQMQREIQWFKEVEKFVNPAFKEKVNSLGKTPGMLFSEHHKDLVIEGEKWMKDTATSCTIAAALIATVVFAAAITVPGGNNQDTGIPIFSREIAFVIFAVSDAVSLFTSTASLLMFLSILTSRYAEADFLYVLPKRLIIGLVTLFLSITSMMITFSATLYLVFFKSKAWVLIPVAALACLPVTLFVSLQFPLLVDVISSTYGPGIFGKKSDRPFY